MLAQSDAWTEGALDALSKALVEATIQQASATLQALRLKRDYAPTQSHASNVMKANVLLSFACSCSRASGVWLDVLRLPPVPSTAGA